MKKSRPLTAALRLPLRLPLARVLTLTMALLISLSVLLIPASFAQEKQEKVDAGMVNRIWEEGVNRSKIMETLSYLTDVIGPRIPGSPAMRKAQEWARDNGIPQLPTADSGQPSAVSGQQLPIHITRPDDGTLYKITPQTPIETQRIPVQAIAADGVQIERLTLFVDGQPIGVFDSVPVRTWWTLSPGRHVFTVEAIDRQGNKLAGAPVTIVVTQ